MIQLCQISQCATWGMGEYHRQKISVTMGKNILVRQASCHEALIDMHHLDESDIVFKRDDPVFGRIEEIIIFKNKQVYLWCKEWPVLWLESSLNAYCVEEGTEYRLERSENLRDFKPFALWRDYKCNETYIALRHMFV